MSVVNWLGVIDRTWGLAPLFTLGSPKKTSNTGLIEKNLLSLSYGAIIRKDIDSSEGLVPASYETYQIVEPGDVVLRFTDLQNDQRSLRSGLVTERGIITSAYMSLTPNLDRVLPRFLAYMMRAIDINKVFYRMGSGVRQSLNWSEFSLMRIPLPPLETQQRIADYLDRETAEIGAAVVDLDRYVELLRKRQLAAEDAIIWGESVEYVRLKFLIDELDERAGQNRVDWPLLSVSIHNGVQERIEDRSKIQAVSDKLDHYKVVQTGDIVLNRMRAFQGALGISSSAGLTSPDYAVLRSHDESSAMWITLVMKTRKFVSLMAMNIRGIGSVDQGNARTPRINVSQLFDFKIPMPDKIHRDQIVEMILRDQDELRRIVAESNHLRELLLKRRSVLITDVVTGRKQV